MASRLACRFASRLLRNRNPNFLHSNHRTIFTTIPNSSSLFESKIPPSNHLQYEGQVPDLFREGHSVVVEGFVKPITEEIKNEATEKSVSVKARSVDCYFSASEVLAKHDEKYMPAEVANAIEKNKKKLVEEATNQVEGQEAVSTA
ncbi:hypothetical protein L1987_88352 [Smallanthus sonchifolius]|nr:hypothetical protein L1987_88352 [Smallanthus sonchifolius]